MISFRNVIRLLAVAMALGSNCISAEAQDNSLHKIEIVRLDPRFDKLVPLNVKVEKIAGGHKWVEGPVWNRKEGYLLFSDIPTNSVIKWQEGKGTSVFLKPSGYTGKTPFEGLEPGSNGLTYDREGRLVLADHGDRRVARLERNGRKTTLVDHFDGKRINSPNDVVFKSNGDLYFTDRRSLLHRSTVRFAKIVRRPTQRNSIPRRLSLFKKRQAHSAHEGYQSAQRHRLLAGRKKTLHQQRRPSQRGLDGL